MNGAEDRGLVSRVGPVQVDWPRSAGYFGGVALAVGAGLVDPPLGVFIAAAPFLRMLSNPGAPRIQRMVSQFFDGMTRPVGGDDDGYVRLVPGGGASKGRSGARRATQRRTATRRRAGAKQGGR